jgi:hypothetical protein
MKAEPLERCAGGISAKQDGHRNTVAIAST